MDKSENTESKKVNSTEVISTLVDLTQFPQRLGVESSYEVTIATCQYQPDWEYIPNYLLDELLNLYKGEVAELIDFELLKNCENTFKEIARDIVFFNEDSVPLFVQQTGLHNLIIYFVKYDSFFIGLDMDFVLIFSKTTTGFIEQSFGLDKFNELALEKYSEASSGLSSDAFNKIFELVRNANKLK